MFSWFNLDLAPPPNVGSVPSKNCSWIRQWVQKLAFHICTEPNASKVVARTHCSLMLSAPQRWTRYVCFHFAVVRDLWVQNLLGVPRKHYATHFLQNVLPRWRRNIHLLRVVEFSWCLHRNFFFEKNRRICRTGYPCVEGFTLDSNIFVADVPLKPKTQCGAGFKNICMGLRREGGITYTSEWLESIR